MLPSPPPLSFYHWILNPYLQDQYFLFVIFSEQLSNDLTSGFQVKLNNLSAWQWCPSFWKHQRRLPAKTLWMLNRSQKLLRLLLYTNTNGSPLQYCSAKKKLIFQVSLLMTGADLSQVADKEIILRCLHKVTIPCPSPPLFRLEQHFLQCSTCSSSSGVLVATAALLQ